MDIATAPQVSGSMDIDDRTDIEDDAEFIAAEPVDPAAPPLSNHWNGVPPTVVKSAGRALQILEFFDDTRRAANMMVISRALHYPESSTSILLRSLVTLGYLDYDRRKRTYRPTSRVRLLGSWIDPPLFQNDGVIQLMQSLNDETRDVVMLASRNGLCSQYIHVVQAQTALRLHLTPGTMRPIARSATGSVLLSTLSDLEIAKLVRRINSEVDNLDELVKISDLLQEIEGIRRDGHVLARSRVTKGTTVLAMPLPARLTATPMVVAIGGATARMEERYHELVDLMSRRMQEHLGG